MRSALPPLPTDATCFSPLITNLLMWASSNVVPNHFKSHSNCHNS
nr:MAG TPA: hypothetical protein [Caudoviricetes sp.]